MQLPAAANIVGQTAQQTTTGHDAFRELDLEAFLQLLISELRNQDPMDPIDNAQLLQQVSQIREIESNLRLSETLEAVQLGEKLNAAAGMLGHTILALDDEGQLVTGEVDRVTVEDNVPKLHLGDYTVELTNVKEILPRDGQTSGASSAPAQPDAGST